MTVSRETQVKKDLEKSRGIEIVDLKIVKGPFDFDVAMSLGFEINSSWDMWGNGHTGAVLGSETEMIVEPYPSHNPDGGRNNVNPKEWLIILRKKQ